jgi:hypothetical protein
MVDWARLVAAVVVGIAILLTVLLHLPRWDYDRSHRAVSALMQLPKAGERTKIRTGDVLLLSQPDRYYSGDFFGTVIRCATGSPFHHAALAWVDDQSGRPMIIHMTTRGLLYEPLEAAAQRPRGSRMALIRLEPALSPEQVRAAAERTPARFDPLMTMIDATHRILPVVDLQSRLASPGNVRACSKYTVDVLRACGVLGERQVAPAAGEGAIWPRDLLHPDEAFEVLPPYRFLPPIEIDDFGRVVVYDDVIPGASDALALSLAVDSSSVRRQ